MKTTNKYLDEIMNMHPNVRNDSKLSDLIGVSRAAVSQYRGGRAMSVPVAIRVARILGVSPLSTVSATMYEQSRDEEEKRFWRHVYWLSTWIDISYRTR